MPNETNTANVKEEGKHIESPKGAEAGSPKKELDEAARRMLTGLLLMADGGSLSDLKEINPNADRNNLTEATSRRESYGLQIDEAMQALARGEEGPMQEILKTCAGVFESLNVRDEILRTLGYNPKEVSPKEARDVMNRPEHQDTLNDLLSGLQTFAADYTNLMAAFGPDPNAMSPKTRQALYAMTNGLEAETRWKKLRYDYAHGVSAETIDLKEAASLREAAALQRNLIARNGSLASQGTLQTDLVRDIPNQMVSLMNRIPANPNQEDFRDVMDGMTLQNIMVGADPGDRLRHTLACASTSLAANLLGRGLLKFAGPHDFLALIEESGLDHTVKNRSGMLIARIIGYGLASGKQPEELLTNPDSFRETADAFAEFLKTHPAKDADGNEIEENLRAYDNYCYKAYQALTEITVPTLGDPLDRAADSMKLQMFFVLDMELSDRANASRRSGRLTSEQAEELHNYQKTANLMTLAARTDYPDVDPRVRAGGIYLISTDFYRRMEGRLFKDSVPSVSGFNMEDISLLGGIGYLLNGDLRSVVSGRKELDVSAVNEVINQNPAFSFARILNAPSPDKAAEAQKQANPKREAQPDKQKAEQPAAPAGNKKLTPMEESRKEFMDSLTRFEEELAANSKTFGDSRYMKDVKEKVAGMKTALESGGPDTDRQKAYQDLVESCRTYLDKRAKARSFEKGETRKAIVSNLMKTLRTVDAAQWASGRAPQDLARLHAMSDPSLSGGKLNFDQPNAPEKDAQIRFDREEAFSGKSSSLRKDLRNYARTLASLDVRQQLLDHLGIAPEAGQSPARLMEEAMKDPDLQPRINEYLSSLSLWASGVSKTLQSAPFREIWDELKKKDTLGSNSDFAAAERSLSAMSKGLSAEARWKALQEDYKNGYEVDKNEAAAVREALKVQRAVISEKGMLCSQNIHTSAMISSIPNKIQELITDANPSAIDFSAPLKHVSLKDIMSEKADHVLPAVTNAFAAKKYAVDMQENPGLAKMLGISASVQGYYKLHERAGLPPLTNDNQFIQMAIGYGLKDKTTSLSQLLGDPYSLRKAVSEYARHLVGIEGADEAAKKQMAAQVYLDIADGLQKVQMPNCGKQNDRIQNELELQCLQGIRKQLQPLTRNSRHKVGSELRKGLTREQKDSLDSIYSCLGLAEEVAMFDHPRTASSSKLGTKYLLSLNALDGQPLESIPGIVKNLKENDPIFRNRANISAYLSNKSDAIIAGNDKLDTVLLDAIFRQAEKEKAPTVKNSKPKETASGKTAAGTQASEKAAAETQKSAAQEPAKPKSEAKTDDGSSRRKTSFTELVGEQQTNRRMTIQESKKRPTLEKNPQKGNQGPVK